MTYDSHVRTIEVTVGDNGRGALAAAVTGTDGENSWTNTYRAGGEEHPGTLSGAENLAVTKVISGREWKAGDSFTFTLTGGDSVTREAIKGGTVRMPENAGGITIAYRADAPEADHAASFGDIVFTEAGNYVFNVAEQVPAEENRLGGMSYDAEVRQVAVSVSDQLDGTLKAEVTGVTPVGLTFTNTYTTEESTALSGEANLKVTKILEGRDWMEGDTFTFTLAAGDETTASAVHNGTVLLGSEQLVIDTASENHEGAFGDITFTEPGTYTFKVSELPSGISGVTDDPQAERILTVKVTDNLDGTLSAAVEEAQSESLAFTNTYDAADGTLQEGDASLTVTKVLEGRDWNDSDQFTFTLEPADEKTEQAIGQGTVVPADTEVTIDKHTAGHAASFGAITFKEEGTYSFTIREEKGSIANVAYDSHTVTVDVTVTDNQKGQLEAAAVSENIAGGLTFTNTYTPDPVTASVGAVKAMEGRALRPDDKFTFTISAAEDSPEGTPLPDVTTAVNGEDGSVKFAPMTYTEAGTYRYQITETGGQAPGVTNSTEAVTAVVDVTYDPATGVLTASVSYENGNTITNTYHAEPTEVGAVPDFTARKTVTASGNNSYTMKGGEFAFTITRGAQNPGSDPVETQTVQNDADGNVVFARGAVYTEPGTYTYTVAEKSGSAAGITYDDAVYVITVKVTDPGDGQLRASYSLTKDGKAAEAVTFENTYDPQSVSVNLSGRKELSGKDLEDGEFRFRLEGVNASVPATEAPEVTPEPTETPEVTPEPTEAPEVAPEPTETPEVTPEPTEAPEVVPEPMETPEVTPEPTEAPEVAPEPTETPETTTEPTETPEPTEAPETATTEGQAGEGTLQSLRAESIRNLLVDETVSSRLVNTLPPMPEETEASNNAAGYFQFGNITYTAPGTYTYRIVEVNDGEEGVTYDGTVYNVTVQVTDENGVLKAETAVTAGGTSPAEEIVFRNSYQAAPVTLSGDTAIRGTKTLEGRELKEGEFRFELIDADNRVAGTAVNQADGSFVFGDLTFDREGTYLYTMREVQNGLGGITYDESTYAVRITVTDAGGHLEAAVEYLRDGQAAEEAVFANTYEASGTSVRLSVTKVLSGRILEAGEFTFQVRDESGQVVAEAANDAAGVVSFPEIAYSEAGVYHYTIGEVRGDAEYVTYDETVYYVTVTVTDDLEGSLEARIDFEQEGCPVFQNTYTEPTPEPTEEPTPTPTEEPKEEPTKAPAKTPSQGKPVGAADTGDDTDSTPYVAGGIAGAAVLAALVGVIAARRKRSR